MLQEGEIELINTEEKKEVAIKQLLKGINWITVMLCCMAFFMTRIQLFGSFYTLGIAYVGAMYLNRQTRRWAAILGILGLFSVGRLDVTLVKYILILFLLMAFRLGMQFLGGEFNAKNQAILTGISTFTIMLMSLLLGQATLFNIAVCLLETAVVIGMVMVLAYSVHVLDKKRTTPLTQNEMASMSFLIAGLLGGMMDFYMIVPFFERIYFKDVLIFVLMLAVIFLGGMSSGIIMTLMISTVLVIMGYMPTQFIAIYLFAALIGGLFHFLDRLGIIFAAGLGMLLGFALFNQKVIDVPIIGAYLGAVIISLVIPRNYFGLGDWFGYGTEIDEEKHLVHVQTIITERLNHFSKAFNDLSKTFERISDKEVDFGQVEIKNMIEDTGECICQKCSMNHFCWQDYIKDTYAYSYEMLEYIDKKGSITVADIPEKFKASCINAESFAFTLGFKMDLFKLRRQWQKRFVETRGLISQQFEAISESVNKLASDIQSEFYFNKEDERSIKEQLHMKGIRTKDIMVLENNGRKEEIHIYVHYKGEVDLKERLIEGIEDALDLRVDVIKYEYHIEEKYCYFKLGIKKQFKITAGAAIAAKGDISGDVYSFMQLTSGKYLLALADGMGSGKLANEESTATIELLESFMESGFKNEVAVKMINSALVLKSDLENFSTMDITLVDEYTGIAEFLKLGASTSFLVRGQEVTTIKASSLPIGILDRVDIVSCKKQLKEGDVLIMVTDGILESKNELLNKEETFKHFIKEAKTNNPQYLASYLLEKTKNLLAGEENDDMTIVVARVWKQC